MIVLFCPGKNGMWVWLYVFIVCTRACVCRCDGDVICVGYDLNWVVVCLQWKCSILLVKGRHRVDSQF